MLPRTANLEPQQPADIMSYRKAWQSRFFTWYLRLIFLSLFSIVSLFSSFLSSLFFFIFYCFPFVPIAMVLELTLFGQLLFDHLYSIVISLSRGPCCSFSHHLANFIYYLQGLGFFLQRGRLGVKERVEKRNVKSLCSTLSSPISMFVRVLFSDSLIQGLS